MKFFLILSKRSLAVILSVSVISLLITMQVFSQKASLIDGSTNQLRMIYLKSLKLEADDSNVSHKDIVIPQKFNDVYTEYNNLQKKAGFDLSRFKGKNATVYTYELLGTKREIHLIVCEGAIIGGDIADVMFGGNMYPLK